MARKPSAVLFDLDGTLVDTAPEIAAALNQLLIEERQTALPFASIRPIVSAGTNALIRYAFADGLTEARFLLLRDRLLRIYHTQYLLQSRLFPEMPLVLDEIEKSGLRWGIVTNKIGWLTEPLVQALGFTQRTRCIVSGDTTPTPKPHPAPLYHAARLLDLAPAECVYVGDAETDITAGRAAGMRCLAAGYGYLAAHEQCHFWEPDGILDQPLDLCRWLSEFPG